MVISTFEIGGVQDKGDYLHSFDFSEGKVLSWLQLGDDDATTIHTSSDSDELDNGVEIKDGVRTHHDPDLPPAWCAEAERETPEPEKPLHVDANPSTNFHGVARGAGLPGYAQAAAGQSSQQAPFHQYDSLSEIVCALETSIDFVNRKVVYRTKVLERQTVEQETLLEMIGENRVIGMLFSGEPVSEELLRLMNCGKVQCVGYFDVAVVAAEWSEWKSWRSYKADEASYKHFQTELRKLWGA